MKISTKLNTIMFLRREVGSTGYKVTIELTTQWCY